MDFAFVPAEAGLCPGRQILPTTKTTYLYLYCMERISYKRGLLLSLVLSFIATVPRIVRPTTGDFSYLPSHFLYLWILVFLYWLIYQWLMGSPKLRVLKMASFVVLGGILSVGYHRLAEHFFSVFSRIFADFPYVNTLPSGRKRALLFFRGVAFSVVIAFIEYYFAMLFERQKAIVEIEQLKKEKLEAQLDSLKQQVSPHFLFNSLSTLRTMVGDGASRKYILELSNVYRYLLAFKENDLASLKDELDFMNAYVYVLRERFEDGLDVKISISPELLQKKIPPLVLQLLVENAIKHNIVSLEEPLSIEIFNEGNDGLTVKNNLQPRLSTETGTGLGLENIERRYSLLSGRSVVVIMTNEFFLVKVPILE